MLDWPQRNLFSSIDSFKIRLTKGLVNLNMNIRADRCEFCISIDRHFWFNSNWCKRLSVCRVNKYVSWPFAGKSEILFWIRFSHKTDFLHLDTHRLDPFKIKYRVGSGSQHLNICMSREWVKGKNIEIAVVPNKRYASGLVVDKKLNYNFYFLFCWISSIYSKKQQRKSCSQNIRRLFLVLWKFH